MQDCNDGDIIHTEPNPAVCSDPFGKHISGSLATSGPSPEKCGFEPVPFEAHLRGATEEGDLEFMDTGGDIEKDADSRMEVEREDGSNQEAVSRCVSDSGWGPDEGVFSDPIVQPPEICIHAFNSNPDVRSAKTNADKAFKPISQKECGNISSFEEYTTQTKFTKYISAFEENTWSNSIEIASKTLTTTEFASSSRENNNSKFFSHLEVPHYSQLSSSVPNSSFGDQVEEEDLELMQYTGGQPRLGTRRTLEIAAKHLSDDSQQSPSSDSPGSHKDSAPARSPVYLSDKEPKSGMPGAGVTQSPPQGGSGGSSLPPSAPQSRASSRSDVDPGTDNEEDIDEIPQISLGICAMKKKTDSKPMKQILTRLEAFEYLDIVIFNESVILNEPVDKWPLVDCLVSFYSTDFPLDKAIEYVNLRQPFCLNDLNMQKVLFDRREVYKILQKEGLPVPRYAVVDRDDPNFSEDQVVEDDDQISINGKVFKKPFVEKPLDAEDHNVTIYFQSSAGGGCQRLFRKIGSVSSMYSPESSVRKSGSYIYEEFKPTDGCDVKVYAVGAEYAHAEARKAPGLDGRVERDNNGKEVRYPVLLSHFEKFIARTISLSFKQTVCGFDLLRANGKSFICDVNGFSFVKNNSKYYDDCAKILSTILLKHMAPDFNIPLHLTVLNEEIPVVPTTRGTMMELRCVIGVLRHGDRQPKQKMKMEVFHESFFDLFLKFGGSFTQATKSKIKLKQPRELQAILDTVLNLLELSENKDFELKENLNKLEQLKSVLQMYGYFSGINRKVQMKCLKSKFKSSSSEDERAANCPSILLIAKWGGELTPLGRVHAEALGKAFRCMYPGGASYNDDGSGLLRLHSTFRHDLKIYASDEGRVQMTAAAFAKGLLALDGELTPILVHMVKCAKTNALLDHDESTDEAGDPIASQEDIKRKLREIFSKDRKFQEQDIQELAPTGSHSLRNSIEVIGNPVQLCEKVYLMIQRVAARIREWAAVPNKVQNLTLYNNETFEMMARRWNKLEKDFKTRSGDKSTETGFDISKIPDIYDCIKYDTLHNSHLPLPCQNELYAASKALADVIVPQEYGMTANEKFRIGLKLCTPLLRKIRCDLQRNLDQSAYRLHPKYSENVLSPNRQVRTRLYFTSESHIHSLVNIIRYGGLFPDPDEQWAAADTHLSSVTELNYLSHLVFLLYEDPTKDLKSEERYKLEVQFSPGIRYWEEPNNYPIGSKFFPKSPPNIHETSAKEILRYGSCATKAGVHAGSSSTSSAKKTSTNSLKVAATTTASSSTSDLTNIQRERHRSVENLQRRSSSGNSSANVNIRHSAAVTHETQVVRTSSSATSGGTTHTSAGTGRRSGAKSVIKRKDGSRTVAGRSIATFLSGNVNSGSAPNLSSIFQEKLRRENMLPTAVMTSKLLKDFCPVEVLHNNLNVGQLERFLDHVTDTREGVKTPPIFRHNPSALVGSKTETIIEETDSKVNEACTSANLSS